MKVRYLKRSIDEAKTMTIGKVYVVIGIEANLYRIIDDTDGPYLYEPEQCEIVESMEPEFWVCELGEDGERYAYPSLWSKPGFFEDYHDGVEAVVYRFWADCSKLYGISKSV